MPQPLPFPKTRKLRTALDKAKDYAGIFPIIVELREIWEKNPLDSECVELLAFAYYRIGNYTESRKIIDDFKSRIKNEVSPAMIWIDIQIYMSEGKNSKAVELSDRLVKMLGSTASDAVILNDILIKANTFMLDEAIATLKDFIKIDENDKITFECVEKLQGLINFETVSNMVRAFINYQNGLEFVETDAMAKLMYEKINSILPEHGRIYPMITNCWDEPYLEFKILLPNISEDEAKLFQKDVNNKIIPEIDEESLITASAEPYVFS